jgi:hypothetical protein
MRTGDTVQKVLVDIIITAIGIKTFGWWFILAVPGTYAIGWIFNLRHFPEAFQKAYQSETQKSEE